MRGPLDHVDECDKINYEGGICTCELIEKYGDGYDDEPSNMAAMENGDYGDM